MRYHYEKPTMYRNMYGETYECNHPVYSKCTLFKMGKKGVISDSTNDVGYLVLKYSFSRNLHAPL